MLMFYGLSFSQDKHTTLRKQKRAQVISAGKDVTNAGIKVISIPKQLILKS